MQSTVIIVISNHRTGSGCLSSILHTLGVPMIPTKEPTMSGDDAWEDQDFVRLHREILGEIIGRHYDPSSWRYPVPQFKQGMIAKYRDLLIEKSKQPLWGFKDPRTLWVLDFVLGLTAGLGIDTKCIWLSRDTNDVAASLRRRDHTRWPTDHLNVAKHQRAEFDQVFQRFVRTVAGTDVSYENLVRDPEMVVADLAKLLPYAVNAPTFKAAVDIVKRK